MLGLPFHPLSVCSRYFLQLKPWSWCNRSSRTVVVVEFIMNSGKQNEDLAALTEFFKQPMIIWNHSSFLKSREGLWRPSMSLHWITADPGSVQWKLQQRWCRTSTAQCHFCLAVMKWILLNHARKDIESRWQPCNKLMCSAVCKSTSTNPSPRRAPVPPIHCWISQILN